MTVNQKIINLNEWICLISFNSNCVNILTEFHTLFITVFSGKQVIKKCHFNKMLGNSNNDNQC